MTLDVILGQGFASLWGWSMDVSSEGPLVHPGMSIYALDLMLCMPSQHHAIGLQTDCVVVVPAPVVSLEAARLPRACPMALGYGLPPL